ncbi:MAG TPA: hydrogenase, partial [Polyangiales bacterium]|nr:hydrogenase [Polyangiales bacterium]
MIADVIVGAPSDAELSKTLTSNLSGSYGKVYTGLLLLCLLGTLGLFSLIAYTFVRGIGVWGNNIPVAWGFGIINFVWWIGIG